MSKVIVTTTINPPTEALRKFAAMPDWELVVIGDKKTPTDFHIEGSIYVGPEEQEKYDPDLSEALGWNCVERRNYGFLWALDMGAEQFGYEERRARSGQRNGSKVTGVAVGTAFHSAVEAASAGGR